MSTFDWRQLPSGRARFAGNIRGWDETGHDTFAVDVGGREVFGELKETFTADGNDFGVAIVSFGYLDRSDVGLPITPEKADVEAVDASAIPSIKEVIRELVDSGVSHAPPSFLKQYANSRFTGQVAFSPGWIARVTGDLGARS